MNKAKVENAIRVMLFTDQDEKKITKPFIEKQKDKIRIMINRTQIPEIYKKILQNHVDISANVLIHDIDYHNIQKHEYITRDKNRIRKEVITTTHKNGKSKKYTNQYIL
jgi:hypothetical protein